MKRLLHLSFLLIVLVLLLMGCGGKITTHTTTETLNQTSTQTETVTETQKQTIIQTETLTEKQTETITVTTTVYISSSPTTITSSTTTTLSPTATTPPANGEPAIFTTSDLALIPKLPAEGAFFKVSVIVTNTGSSQGSYDVVLYINGIDIQDNDAIISTETFTKSVVLAPGENTLVSFKKLILPSGYYTLVIDELEEFLESGS